MWANKTDPPIAIGAAFPAEDFGLMAKVKTDMTKRYGPMTSNQKATHSSRTEPFVSDSKKPEITREMRGVYTDVYKPTIARIILARIFLVQNTVTRESMGVYTFVYTPHKPRVILFVFFATKCDESGNLASRYACSE